MLDALAQSPATSAPSSSPLSSFLLNLEDRAELGRLLDITMFVNPSDLFAIVECEKRMKRHTCDRAVCLAVFLADLSADARARCEDAALADRIVECVADAIRATVVHYDPDMGDSDAVVKALQILGDSEAASSIHESFESRFRDWRQMIRSVRRMPHARTLEESPLYGVVTLGTLVTDSVGNMLSHVRHIYCDRAYGGREFCLE